MFDAIVHLLFDFGIMWIGAGPNCPKCGGEGIRPKKMADGKQRWHCQGCCHEWISSRRDVMSAGDNQVGR